MCFYLNSAFGAEIKSEKELTFLKGASKYIGNNGKTKILRPLKEFKVGKKYCLWGTKNWDEACQDAAMKYAFGPEWREFKRVALEFVEHVHKGNSIKLAELFEYPLEDCGICSCSDIINAEAFINYKKPMNHWQKLLGDATYQKAIIGDFELTYRNGYSILLSDSISIVFSEVYDYEKGLRIHYIPKIKIVIIHDH